MVYAIPENCLLSVRKLVRECANYIDGGCIVLDDNCVVMQDSATIICKYYMKSVLPMDNVLYEKVLAPRSDVKGVKTYSKVCKVCGVKFKSLAKTTQLCEKCSKKSGAKRVKKHRASKSSKKG